MKYEAQRDPRDEIIRQLGIEQALNLMIMEAETVCEIQFCTRIHNFIRSGVMGTAHVNLNEPKPTPEAKKQHPAKLD